MTIGDDPGQRAQNVGLVTEGHGQVGVLPLTQHTQTHKTRALDIDLFGGIFTTLLAEFNRIQLGAWLAEFFLHRDLDRQAVAIPARHIRCAIARQQA